MRSIVSILEGIVLITIGILIFLMMLQLEYAYYMNLKFIWLTFLSSIFLLILGVFNLFYPSRFRKLFNLYLFLLLLLLWIVVPIKVIDESSLFQSPF